MLLYSNSESSELNMSNTLHRKFLYPHVGTLRLLP
jgi:hypothetical protein